MVKDENPSKKKEFINPKSQSKKIYKSESSNIVKGKFGLAQLIQ